MARTLSIMVLVISLSTSFYIFDVSAQTEPKLFSDSNKNLFTEFSANQSKVVGQKQTPNNLLLPKNWPSPVADERPNLFFLADMLEYIQEGGYRIDSITIIRNGYMVTDAYFFPFQKGIFLQNSKAKD